MEHYKVPDFQTALEFLSLLARRQGKLRKGGLPDTDKAAKSVLMDWTGWVRKSDLTSLANAVHLLCLMFSFHCYLEEGSATSHTLQRHILFPHTSALRSSQRWAKLLTGMSWKKGIRKFLQVKIKGNFAQFTRWGSGVLNLLGLVISGFCVYNTQKSQKLLQKWTSLCFRVIMS